MKPNDFYKSEKNIKNIINEIEIINNTIEGMDISSLTRPVKFDITGNMWTLNAETNLYELNLVHNHKLPREDLIVKFYSGNSNVLLAYDFVDNNTIAIFNNRAEDILVVIGEYVSVDFYTKTEINEKCLMRDGSNAMNNDLLTRIICCPEGYATNEIGLKTSSGETIYLGKSNTMKKQALRVSTADAANIDLGTDKLPWGNLYASGINIGGNEGAVIGSNIQCGSVSFTSTGNAITCVPVVFPNAFKKSPKVIASALSGVPGTQVQEVSISDITSTGFNAYMYRTSQTGSAISWVAVMI